MKEKFKNLPLRNGVGIVVLNNKNKVFAKLNNGPTSPRKMRLVADQVRGKKVEKALSILKFSQKQPSLRLEKLLLSAINNWQQKNPDSDIEKENLYIKEIRGHMLQLR